MMAQAQHEATRHDRAFLLELARSFTEAPPRPTSACLPREVHAMPLIFGDIDARRRHFDVIAERQLALLPASAFAIGRSAARSATRLLAGGDLPHACRAQPPFALSTRRGRDHAIGCDFKRTTRKRDASGAESRVLTTRRAQAARAGAMPAAAVERENSARHETPLANSRRWPSFFYADAE